jgi:hypothetical protein
MSQAQLALIVPLGELGLGAGTLPSFGGGAGDPGYGKPIFHPGHPEHGLPSSPGHPGGGPVYPPGHPSAGLPIAPGHPANRPPNVPPNVVWPPSNPNRPDNSLPPLHAGTKPIQPPAAGTKPVDPGAALPAGSTLVLAYNAESGWAGAVVDQSGTTKPIAPPEAAPK